MLKIDSCGRQSRHVPNHFLTEMGKAKRELVHGVGSRRWFTALVHGVGSRRWFTALVHGVGSRRWGADSSEKDLLMHHKPMLGTSLDWLQYRQQLNATINQVAPEQLASWSAALLDLYCRQSTVYIIGNGGSASNAGHFCQDLSKSTLPESLAQQSPQKRLRTLNLTDNSGWILAISNDLGYDQVFEQQLRTLANPGDALIAISGSGNSLNVLNAVDYATLIGMKTIGLTGFDGGKLGDKVDLHINVPCDDMGIIESVHLCLFHWVLDDIYAKINRVGRYA